MDRYLDNIMCVPTGSEKSACPITDIEFVSSDEASKQEEEDEKEKEDEDDEQEQNGKWNKFGNLGLDVEYDVPGNFKILNYEDGYTLDDLKNIVEVSGWTGMVI